MGIGTERTEFNEYGMPSMINDTTVIEKAERLIQEGEDPRKAYEIVCEQADQALKQRR